MKIYVEKDDKHFELKFSGSVVTLLKKLRINPAKVIVVRNKKILQLDNVLKNTDKISVLESFMGG